MRKNNLLILILVIILTMLSGCASPDKREEMKKEFLSMEKDAKEEKKSNKDSHGDFLNDFKYDSQNDIWTLALEDANDTTCYFYYEPDDVLYGMFLSDGETQIYDWKSDTWVADDTYSIFQYDWFYEVGKVDSTETSTDNVSHGRVHEDLLSEGYEYFPVYHVYCKLVEAPGFDGYPDRLIYDANVYKEYKVNLYDVPFDYEPVTNKFQLNDELRKTDWYKGLIENDELGYYNYEVGSMDYGNTEDYDNAYNSYQQYRNYQDAYGGGLEDYVYDTMEEAILGIMVENAINYEENYVPTIQRPERWRYDGIAGIWYFNDSQTVLKSWKAQDAYAGPDNWTPINKYTWYMDELTREWRYFNYDDGEYYKVDDKDVARVVWLNPQDYAESGEMMYFSDEWDRWSSYNVFYNKYSDRWYKYSKADGWLTFGNEEYNAWVTFDQSNFVPPINL